MSSNTTNISNITNITNVSNMTNVLNMTNVSNMTNHMCPKAKKMINSMLKQILADKKSENVSNNFLKLFNQHLDLNKNKLSNLFNSLNDLLNEAVNNVSDISIHSKIIQINWVLPITNNKYPMIYLILLKLKLLDKMSYDEFNNLYNMRKIKLGKFMKNKKVFRKISQHYDKIKNSMDIKFNNVYNNNQINNSMIANDIVDNLINLNNYIFISLNVNKYIETNINSCKIYNLEWIDMYIFYNVNSDRLSKLIDDFLIISKWFNLLNQKLNKKIKFLYFDCDIDKSLNNKSSDDKSLNSKSLDDEEKKYISSENVNSGSTTTNKHIIVWRREEASKVFIHELIHFLHHDIKYDIQINNIMKYNIGTIKYPVLINETITEIFAQFFHTIFITNKYAKNCFEIVHNTNHGVDFKFNLFNLFYSTEQIFSLCQFAKIMKYYKINKFSKKDIIKKFNQSSNVFSYFILKSILCLEWSEIICGMDYLKKYIVLDKSSTKKNCNVNMCKPLIIHIKKIEKIMYDENFYDNFFTDVIKYFPTNIGKNSLRMTLLSVI